MTKPKKIGRYKYHFIPQFSVVNEFKEFFVSRKAQFPNISYSAFTVDFDKLSDSKSAENLSLNLFVKQCI
jgi:hypothetical protein